MTYNNNNSNKTVNNFTTISAVFHTRCTLQDLKTFIASHILHII